MVRRRSMFFNGAKLPGNQTGGYPAGSLFLKGGTFGQGLYQNVGTKSACCFVKTRPDADEWVPVAGGVNLTTAGGDTTETITTVGHLPIGATTNHAQVTYRTSNDNDKLGRVDVTAVNTITYIATADPSTAHGADWTLYDKGGVPWGYPVAAGQHTTLGGAAAEALTVTGVAATDVVHAQIHTLGATPRILAKTVPTANTLTFTFADDPSTDHVVNYVVIRPFNSGLKTMNQSHSVFASGTFDSVTGSATQTTTVTGIRTSDIVLLQPDTVADANDTILNCYCTTNGTLGLVQSADPAGTGYTYNYIVFRAI